VTPSPFVVIQGPCSCISSTMSTSTFKSSAQTPLIFASFMSCLLTIFLLVFSIRLQREAFVARSIKLCLVDNQRSSGVMVAGSKSCRFEAKIVNIESPPIDISIYLSVDRAIAYHLVSDSSVPREVILLFPFRFICVHHI
jgi:hypothetical protein